MLEQAENEEVDIETIETLKTNLETKLNQMSDSTETEQLWKTQAKIVELVETLFKKQQSLTYTSIGLGLNAAIMQQNYKNSESRAAKTECNVVKLYEKQEKSHKKMPGEKSHFII